MRDIGVSERVKGEAVAVERAIADLGLLRGMASVHLPEINEYIN